jgi:hypothetical protein
MKVALGKNFNTDWSGLERAAGNQMGAAAAQIKSLMSDN